MGFSGFPPRNDNALAIRSIDLWAQRADAALVAAGNAAAAEARARDASVRLFITVQVEVARGALGGGANAGVARDVADFPFTQALGLSSYP